ncbi:signal peptidase I [Sphaerisporangium sp. NPDC005288]|uniref:signal peptidase I n=1 Tax=Sphaerisporangium sp. NPDC005288 TaxID=3155114 RepID=UPI0033A7C8C3
MSVRQDNPDPQDPAPAPHSADPAGRGTAEDVPRPAEGSEDGPGATDGAGGADRGGGADEGGAPGASGAPGAPGVAKEKKKSGWRESVVLVLIGVLAAVLVRLFVLDSFWIPSESMENTLLIDDRVVVNRITGDIDRGEVVVFTGWDGTTLIKRVIGVGGDHVKCCDAKGRITVNGVALDERSYLNPQDYPSQENFDITVPKGRLWLMGDHRAASEDSRAFMKNRYHGTISTGDVVGRAFALYWPLSRVGTLPVPETFAKVR